MKILQSLIHETLHCIPPTVSCIQPRTPSHNITLRIVLSLSTHAWNTVTMRLALYIYSCLILLEELAGAIFPAIQKNCRNLMTASTTVIFQHTNHQVSLCLLLLSSTLRLSWRHSLLLLKCFITANITLFKVCTLINLAKFMYTLQPNQQSKQNLKNGFCH